MGLWLTAFALLSQSLALAASPMQAGDAEAAARQLTAAFGPGVVICVQDDAPSSPPLDCHDQCPHCQLAAHAAALDAPPQPAILAIVRGPGFELNWTPPPAHIPSARAAFSYPRGPPSKT